jgi:deoxyribonuclease-4
MPGLSTSFFQSAVDFFSKKKDLAAIYKIVRNQHIYNLMYRNGRLFVPDDLLVGAHTSTQGGLHKAIEQGKEIGARTIQLFTSNQRQWAGRKLSQTDIDLWNQTLEEHPMSHIMSHASYLINLGSNDEALLQKSRQAFSEEIERCLALDLTFLNFHPGASTGDSEEACLERIVQSLRSMEPLFTSWIGLRMLIETTAGQGSNLGHTFEQLAYIVKHVRNWVPIGICIDTCHLFAAGYDIRTYDGWWETLKKFDSIIGLEHLYAIHVNDSIGGLGSRKDRHANLGAGALGMDCFKAMLEHTALQPLPKYLETPNGATMWTQEIALLRQKAEEVYRRELDSKL